MSMQLSVLSGALNYEFRMQIRRVAFWVTFLIISLFTVGFLARSLSYFGGVGSLGSLIRTTALTTVIANWVSVVNLLLPLGAGCLLADRVVRDHRTGVDELLTTLPGTLSARLVGKYLGCTLATIIPFLVFYCLGVGVILYYTQNFLTIPLALAAFSSVILPGLFFVSAFSLACPTVIWLPLFQFLFVGYWFWGNILNPRLHIPTLNGTMLAPDGAYASQAFFGSTQFDAPSHVTILQGVESISLLVGIAVLVIVLLWVWLKRRQFTHTL